jgi:hypothetical protein
MPASFRRPLTAFVVAISSIVCVAIAGWAIPLLRALPGARVHLLAGSVPNDDQRKGKIAVPRILEVLGGETDCAGDIQQETGPSDGGPVAALLVDCHAD